jgi:hypothetical protein
MRLITIALFTLLFTMTATAIPLPITIDDMHDGNLAYGGTNPGDATGGINDDVLGLLRNFDIDYVQFTIIGAQEVEALIHVNYAGGGVNPITGTWDYSIHGHPLTTGDLLFDVGNTYKWGVALTSHNGLTAGTLYQIANVQTSDGYLGTHDGIRPHEPVLISAVGATPVADSNIAGGLFAENDVDSAWFITVRFNPGSSSFLTDLANTGLSVHYASATCANDILDGFIQYNPIPEPMSMVLMGGGLLALGLFGRRFRRG